MVILVYGSIFPAPSTCTFLPPSSIAFFKHWDLKWCLSPSLLKRRPFGGIEDSDFTWKDLLDLYACAVCGRCHASCPAHLSGKTLSPREVIHNLKEHLLEAGPGLLAGQAKASSESRVETQVETQAETLPKTQPKEMIGDVVIEEEIWACTTCGACQEVCPVNSRTHTQDHRPSGEIW